MIYIQFLVICICLIVSVYLVLEVDYFFYKRKQKKFWANYKPTNVRQIYFKGITPDCK